jgi:hypothetical protein
MCIFDNDGEGREQRGKIKPTSYAHMSVTLVDLPRYDGASPDNTKGEWEIEDFLPCNLVFSAINKILRKLGYKIISRQQENERSLSAHAEKQILRYAGECSSHSNPDKTPVDWDNEGRKKQVCQIICTELINEETKKLFTKKQIDFLKEIAK